MRHIVLLLFTLLTLPVSTSLAIAGQSSIRQTQEALVARGYDPGPTDGLVGPKTQDAVRSFQRDHSLTVSGHVNSETATALGVPPWGTVKAKALSVQYAMHAKNMGAVEFALGANGPAPLMPKETVYVFREISDPTLARRLSIHIGGAYWKRKDRFVFIRDVDLSKSDSALANEFGVGSK